MGAGGDLEEEKRQLLGVGGDGGEGRWGRGLLLWFILPGGDWVGCVCIINVWYQE